jgi:hypothetical protein
MRLIGNRHGDPVTLLSEADRQERFAEAVKSTRRPEYAPDGSEIAPEPPWQADYGKAWAREQERPHDGVGDRRDPFSEDEHLGFTAV